MKFSNDILATFIIFLLLAGCGGGGGDNGDKGNEGDGGDNAIPTTSTLSGTLRVAASSIRDSDVNDPLATFQANDDAATAQPLPNPVSLGGYINQPGSGPEGASKQRGDPADWFRVSLAAGQSITLFIAEDGLRNDLDLLLFDHNTQLVDASLGTTQFESLPVNQGGDYFVTVRVSQGASNYVLTIGQQSPPPQTNAKLSDDFVPGEIVVRFASGSSGKELGLTASAQSVGLGARAGAEGRNMLLSLEGVDRSITATTLGIDELEVSRVLKDGDPVQRLKLDTLYVLKALQRRADVLYAAPNFVRRPLFTPNDPLSSQQWHYPLLNLSQAWDVNTGTGAIVAVLDTGVLLDHPDLQGQFLDGYDFIRNPDNAGDGDGIDADPSDPGDDATPGGSTFHGTHVSGTVAAATHNATGVAGVAFAARLMPLRVAGRLGTTDYDIEQATRFAAGLPNDSGTVPPRRADVINLSLGGPSFSAAAEAFYNQVRAAGVVIVAAAGNNGDSVAFYPASYPGVISVSAVDITKAPSPFSSFGPFVDVAAPGGNMAQDINGDGNPDGVLSTAASNAGGSLNFIYNFYQGTSMAAPHVAGVVALMRAVNPALTPQDIDNLLASGALTEDLGSPGRDDRFGHGLINAYRAVVAAANTAGGQPITPVPILVVNPTALNFGTALSSLTVTVSNGGSGNLTVNPPNQDSSGWLSLSPTVDGNGLGSYTLTAERSNLPDGVYTATLTFTSTANTVQVPVILQIANNLKTGDAGQQYVLLVAPDSLATVGQANAVQQGDGVYGYRFTEVVSGNYEIFSGSDFNNDGFICDPGEFCGAYLTLDKPVNISVNGDRSDLDFTVGLSAHLTDLSTVPNSSPGTRALSRSTLKRLAR